MAGLFPDAVRVGCVAAIVAGAIVTRFERDQPGGGWWMLLATGAALSAAGAALAAPEATETAGGIVALAGAVLAVIGATVGFPLREHAE